MGSGLTVNGKTLRATFLRVSSAGLILGVCSGLSGCMSSPTYGTGRSSGEQLADDLTGIMSIQPKRRAAIAYQPRPDLVKPAPGSKLDLPPPQESIASNNPQWPESPEQRRARIRADADANRDKVGFQPQVVSDGEATDVVDRPSAQSQYSSRLADQGMTPDKQSPGQQRSEFKKRLAETQQGSPTNRKYLSEPPLAYREPAGTAATGDLGEDEAVKERRLKAEAKKKAGGGSSWWPF